MKDTRKAFLWITGILDKKNIDYKILGGFAARVYGVDRELADIDIEVLDEDIYKIVDEVREYIILGPSRYLDDNWDLNLLTLNYCGQEIDICGADALIFNKSSKQWENLSSESSKVNTVEIFNKKVPIVSVEKLIDYKSKLQRGVDTEDVRQLKILSQTK